MGFQMRTVSKIHFQFQALQGNEGEDIVLLDIGLTTNPTCDKLLELAIALAMAFAFAFA